jgi:hypothetical protein
MITLYSKYRRMNLRRAWEFSGMSAWCMQVGKYLACFILALIVAQMISDAFDTEQKLIEAQAEKTQLEFVIMSCLNHGGVMIQGELHLCRPVNTGIKS